MTSRWREALDGKAAVLRTLRDPRSWKLLGDRESTQTERAASADWLSSLTRQAPTYYWAIEQADTVSQAMKDEESLDEPFYRMFLPSQEGFYWFQEPAQVQLSAVDDGFTVSTWIRAIIWDSYGRNDPTSDILTGRDNDEPIVGMSVFVIFDQKAMGGQMQPWPAGFVVEGKSILRHVEETMKGDSAPVEYVTAGGKRGSLDPSSGEEAKTALASFAIGFVWKSCRFLRERLRVEAPLLDRSVRRYAARMQFDPEVRVIHWRKTEYEYPEDHESQPIDWSCHWTVKRHTRTYKRDGRTITIEPYVKGNLLAPYKPPAEVEINVVDQ